MGQSFAARVAASLLNALDLPELITTTQADYEAQAIALAQHPERLKAIKNKLMRNRLANPLFDGKRFAKYLEAAYLAMHERRLEGLAPDMIVVEP